MSHHAAGVAPRPSTGVIVVEHRDGRARFGVEYLEAALAGQGRRLEVVAGTEVRDGRVHDMAAVVTRFCVRRCGRRSATRWAKSALAAAGKTAP